jgi:hypothetical protein
VFEEGEEYKWCEEYGEEFSGCPVCHEPYEETKRCVLCGEWNEYDVCQNCVTETIKNFQHAMEQFNEVEKDVLRDLWDELEI